MLLVLPGLVHHGQGRLNVGKIVGPANPRAGEVVQGHVRTVDGNYMSHIGAPTQPVATAETLVPLVAMEQGIPRAVAYSIKSTVPSPSIGSPPQR